MHGPRRAYDHLLWLARSNHLPRKRVEEVLALVGLERVARKRVGGVRSGPMNTVTFADLARSEWTKLRSLRSTAYTLLALLVIGIGMSALVTSSTARRYTDMTAGEQAAFDPTMQSLQSFFLVQLVISVLGVMVVTSEHATGMIRTTPTAMPLRGRLLAAPAMSRGSRPAGPGGGWMRAAGRAGAGRPRRGGGRGGRRR
ncbi:hypothetical protein [Flindersiella endophytica]